MEINPYAAPQAQVLQTTSQDELVRKEHINTEATIKSVGILYYLGSFGLVLYGVGSIGMSISARSDASWVGILIGVVLLAFGIGQGIVAYGLRRLQNWARIPTIILSSIGLLGFPIGTLINIYILVKVSGQQGKFIMTPEYQRIIAATPHVKRKTSVVVWVILIALIILLIGIIAANSYRN
ncbi:MAG: hypothetical protein K9N47_06320 [Prosthecobacter sp.]|uniref:hypothetical protein n=1 Tax=Prosthecobacter sp. TaxID=1965333 RepID=UPI0025D40D4A|nr:hypothetical protein [Prosthecobacter sp.]MCF7785717.1 hypothetical protein [Prosthecobacter sp.]